MTTETSNPAHGRASPPKHNLLQELYRVREDPHVNTGRQRNATVEKRPPRTVDPPPSGVGLWLRWVLANAAGEALGLGATALFGAAILSYLGEGTALLATLGLAAAAVVAGTVVEGGAVGFAQWSVLRGPLPAMRWRTWTLATAAGAFLAWTLGMAPSTLLSLGGNSGGAAPAEPGEATMLGLAFLMGLALGPVLGLAQWLALRRYVRRAALWMPANSLAWASGMVVIFTGIDLATRGGFGLRSVAILALTLVVTGAVVGAIHGLVLVRLVRGAQR